MGAIEDAKAYGLTLRESATDGSDFTNPDADYRRFWLGEDGILHLKDSAGTITDVGAGATATDTIWDAKGDLAVGTGSNTAAKLTAGANGKVPTYASGETTGMIPAYPPGYEFDYVEKTSATSITATSEGTANTILTGTAVTYDGSTIILIEFSAPAVRPDAGAASRFIDIILTDGGTILGIIGEKTGAAAVAADDPMRVSRRLTPSAGAHTYDIRAYVGAGTAVVYGGAGGTGGALVPAYMRITKV